MHAAHILQLLSAAADSHPVSNIEMCLSVIMLSFSFIIHPSLSLSLLHILPLSISYFSPLLSWLALGWLGTDLVLES